MAANDDSISLFAAVLLRLEEELDWELLGRLYCEEGGEDFFPPEQREAIRETGLRLADDVAGALGALRGPGCGRSLYLGAGVAELAPILCETLVLKRKVVWTNLGADEVSEVGRATVLVAREFEIKLPKPRPLELTEINGPFDHLWLVSVLTDPDTFPALGAELYGRAAPGRRAARNERVRAVALVDQALERLSVPAVLTTTDEELEVIGPRVEAGGTKLDLPSGARLSGIVGDPIRVCRRLAL